jgi:flagella basal body P-ring formation protein FlgA
VSAAQGFGRGATTTVVVAQTDVPERTLFTGANVPDLLTTRQLPSDAVPPGALRSAADAVGKATLLPLLPGHAPWGAQADAAVSAVAIAPV